jgi:ABC-type bacteriocin/lantibiotic exporters, contain an N-terminal double-glycine peptidase domain
MRLLITFVRKYPRHSVITLFALLLAGAAEGFGITGILTLLSGIGGNGVLKGSLSKGGSFPLAHFLTNALAALGLSPTIGMLLAVLVAGFAVKSLFMLLANKRVGYTVAHVATDLRLALLRALLNTRWEYYLGQPVGVLVNSFATEASRASHAYESGAKMAALLIQAIIYLIIGLSVSWKAMLTSMAAGVIIIYGLSHFVRMSRRAGGRQTSLLQSSLARMTDTLQSIKPLKAMAREELADAVLVTETKLLNKAMKKDVFSKEALKSFQEPMLTGLLGFGIFVALDFLALPLASIMGLVFVIASMVTKLNKVQQEYQKMVTYESAYWSLQEKIRKAEHEQEKVFGTSTPSLERSVRLDNVNFKYGKHWVLQKASLEFPAGFFTAITGASGTGKTTVADLLIGLLRPQKGQIWIDGQPLSTIDIRSWRRMIGYVPQETLLLHDTVMKNVTLGAPDLSEKDVESALIAADIWDFVATMPQGMHTTVGERGGKLSGGQRQRIAIARALVHNPSLLILDEATSGLDPETETRICDTLRGLRGKLTILAISHQPALINAADRAYRIQDGRAVLTVNRAYIEVDSEHIGAAQS